MPTRSLRLRALALVAGAAILAFSAPAGADPPSRVARLGYMSGAVSFSPAGENDWVQATVNRPLTTGDRLWSDAGARAEIQVGGAAVRVNADTAVSILNLDDRVAQLRLTQGTLNVRVRRLEADQIFEVDTPNLAFTLREPGEYRIEADPDGNATTIVVRSGRGEVYGEGAAYTIDSRQPYRFTGTDLRDYRYVDAPRPDDFDRWSNDRDRSYDRSASARYVSQDVIGYQDLDANGSWRIDATYGNVWYPNRVAADWAPFRDGHWAWVDPWGWTWIDDAPWGFAVSHYGRWANLRGTWGWIPGPVRSRAYYAPALVVFVGGANFQIAISSGGSIGGIAWFPLAPREVYRPSYPVSRGYFENINRSNTVINTTVINNYYDNSTRINVVHANRQVPGAVIAVPTTTFVQAQPVTRTMVRVPQEAIATAPVAVIAPVAPTERSVRGAAAQADKPPQRVFERPVVARTAPPEARAGFAAQRQQLSAQPGAPLDEAARKDLKPEAAAPAPVVRVVPQPREAPAALPPRSAASGTKPDDVRERPDQRGRPATPATSSAPSAPSAPRQAMPGNAPSQAAPSAPASQAPAERAKPEQREKPEQRVAPEQRGRGEQRGQSIATPPAIPPASPSVAPAARPPETPQLPAQGATRPGAAAVPQPPPQARQPEQRARPERAPADDKTNERKRDRDDQRRDVEDRRQ